MSKAVYVRNREAEGILSLSVMSEDGQPAGPTRLGPGESATVHIEEGEYLRIDDVTNEVATESQPDPADDEGSDAGEVDDKAQVADDD